jgi:hypothetical protein
MPRRKVELDVKVAAMRESLQLTDAECTACKHNLSKQSMYNWYARVLEALPDILADDKPGRKRKPKVESAPPF